MIVLYILCRTLVLLCYALDTAIFARVVCHWFDPMEEKTPTRILTVLTEPFILPFRYLLARMRAGEGLPIHLALLVSMLVYSTAAWGLPYIPAPM